MPSLAVIIVSWNTRELLLRCIESVHASLVGTSIDYRVVVVDNASSDGTPAQLRAAHPEVQLIEAGRNLGFAGGNNLALRVLLDHRPPTADHRPPTTDRRPRPRAADDEAQKPVAQSKIQNPKSKIPDYVLLLNPDTEVVGDAIARLIGYLEAHPDVAVVGPQLRYPDGGAQPSRRRFPSRGVFFWESTPLEQRWPGNPWAQRYRCADRPDEHEQEVDWLVGAALLVRRTAIERAGLLDAGFAMYSEELEWQQRIRRPTKNQEPRTKNQEPRTKNQEPGALWANRVPSGRITERIVYLPDAVIIHHEGQSSAQAPAQRYINFQRSRIRHASMLYGVRFAGALRLFLRAAYTFELMVEAAKWLLGHKRPLRAERTRVYLRVLHGL